MKRIAVSQSQGDSRLRFAALGIINIRVVQTLIKTENRPVLLAGVRDKAYMTRASITLIKVKCNKHFTVRRKSPSVWPQADRNMKHNKSKASPSANHKGTSGGTNISLNRNRPALPAYVSDNTYMTRASIKHSSHTTTFQIKIRLRKGRLLKCGTHCSVW